MTHSVADQALFRSPSHFAAHHYGQPEDLPLIAASSSSTAGALAAFEAGQHDLARRLWMSVDGERLLETWNRWNRTWKTVGTKWDQSAPTAIAPKTVGVSLRLARTIYERDGYRCRYCDIEVFARSPGSPIVMLVSAMPELTPGLCVRAGRLRGSGKSGSLRNVDYSKFLWSMAAPEHVFPRSLGGPTTMENLVTACWGCNGWKQNLTLAQLQVEALRPTM